MSREGATERARRGQIAEIEWECVWKREIGTRTQDQK